MAVSKKADKSDKLQAKEKVKTDKLPEKKSEKKETVVASNLPSLQELLEAGAHFGHSVKRRNPRMDEYIYAVKNGVQIFDLVKTHQLLGEACQYLEETVAQGGVVLVVGTKGQAAEVVRKEGERVGYASIVNRWVGGLFTNYEEIKKRIELLIEMKAKMEAGDYKKYTKKEQVLKKREIERLERMYGGLVSLSKLPDVLVIIDPTREVTAMREATAKKIPVVAVVDSNCDPTEVTHLIPANDDALKTVDLLVKALASAIERGMKKAKNVSQK